MRRTIVTVQSERADTGSAQPQRPDVFVSYAREDRPFVLRLTAALKATGKDVWIDLEDIPKSADWRAKIEAGIESTRAVVPVLSPDFAASDVCAEEVGHALRHNKRMVPVVCREVAAARLRAELNAPNWIFFREADDFDAALIELREALEIDLEWLDAHARLLVRAVEWDRARRDTSLLLRGSDLRTAESWLTQQGTHRETATPLQGEYILASRRATTRRQRITFAAVAIALVVSIALGVLAVLQRNNAIENERQARSRELAASAMSQLGSDPELSVLLAREAIDVERTAQATTALRLALANSHVSRTFPRAGGAVDDLHLSHDGRLLLTASSDRVARVRDWRTGRVLARLGGHRNPCPTDALAPPCEVFVSALRAVFSPSARLVATAGDDGTVVIWEWRTHRVVSHFRTVAGSIAFSPDGRLLATAGVDIDAAARVWDWKSKTVVSKLVEPSDLLGGQSLSTVAFSPDGRLLLTASAAGNVRVWDWAKRRLLVVMHQPGVLADAAFDERGGRVIAGGEDGIARIWDWKRRRRLAELRGHTAGISSVAFSPDGRLALTASADGTARVWDSRTGDAQVELRGHHGSVMAASFGESGRVVVTGGSDGTVRVWSRLTRTPLARLVPDKPPGSLSFLTSVDFSLDGRLLVTGGVEPGERGPTARLWDWSHGKSVAVLREGADAAVGETGPQLNAALAPDGRWVVVASRSTGVRLWDWRRNVVRELSKPPVDKTAMSANGTLLVTAAQGGQVDVLDRKTGSRLAGWTEQSNPLLDVSMSPDGRYVATVVQGEPVRVRDWRDGSVVSELRAPAAVEASFSADGEFLVTAGTEAVVWNWRAGRSLAQLSGPGTAVSARLNPDADLVLVVNTDGHARVWAWRAEQLVLELSPEQSFSAAGFAHPREAALSRDGRLVATASDDGVAHVFACDACGPIDQLIRSACGRVTRNLDRAEWRRYMGNAPYAPTCRRS